MNQITEWPRPKKRGGARLGAGRKKKLSTQIQEALLDVDADIPAIFAMLREKALSGDKDCAFYLINQRLGKPTERHEIVGALERPLKIEFVLTRKKAK